MSDEMNAGGEDARQFRIDEALRRAADAAADPAAAAPVVRRMVTDPEEKRATLVEGSNFSPATQIYVAGCFCSTEFLSPTRLRLREAPAPAKAASVVASHGPIASIKGREMRRAPTTLNDVRLLTDLPLKTRQKAAVEVSFESAEGATVKLIRLEAIFPDGERIERVYPVTRRDAAGGRAILEGFMAEEGGTLELRVEIFDDEGGSDALTRRFGVVPSNPLQLYVTGRHRSPRNRAAAHWQGSAGRYRVDWNFRVSNGYPYAVTLGPLVRCRVSDAGLGELADFWFSITPTTVPANTTWNMPIFTTHSGGSVYDLFRDFGDAKFEFWVFSTRGMIFGWNVAVAAAQVGVTANFVGTFSAAETAKVVEMIDTFATDIFAKQDCIFSPNTPILFIPNTHPDWSRYRDIRLEENKDGVCTDSDEARDMRDDWSAPSQYDNRIDIFFVESFSGDACASGVGGFSPVDGPSGKGGSNSGIVIDVKDLNIVTSSWGADIMGLVIAHEVGHFLGLNHSTAANNFMRASASTGNTSITYDQWKEMRDHHFVRRYNP